MKKSILTLSAIAVVGGLGLTTSAQAVVYFGPGNNTTTPPEGVGLELNPGNTGHELIVPYYNVQSGTATSLSIVNTDQTNGKAVKVRFRGAANSDDVLDFTLFLSPADVWTAAISQGSNGAAQLTTSDNSCTQPVSNGVKVSFPTGRFPVTTFTPAQANANTLEGYVDILNMADIPPGSALYTAIKHVNGTPPCTQTVFDKLFDTVTTASASDMLNTYGLDSPSGGLSGSWALLNQTTLAQFSGDDTAVRVVSDLATTEAASVNGLAYIAFSPQVQQTYEGPAAAPITAVSADPLFSGASPLVTPLQFDVPDLSTPILTTAVVGSPTDQAYLLSSALAKTQIENEFWNDPTGAATGIPMGTDWVISQPTRRYFAVVDYAGNKGQGQIVYNSNTLDVATFYTPPGTLTAAGTTATALPYAGILTLVQGPYGPVAALQAESFTVYDREEQSNAPSGPYITFSPGNELPASSYPGEVTTVTFGYSALNAALTNTPTSDAPVTGWAQFVPQVGNGAFIPIIGYAAAVAGNTTSGLSFGATMPHRW
jgi:hypothetical protein